MIGAPGNNGAARSPGGPQSNGLRPTATPGHGAPAGRGATPGVIGAQSAAQGGRGAAGAARGAGGAAHLPGGATRGAAGAGRGAGAQGGPASAQAAGARAGGAAPMAAANRRADDSESQRDTWLTEDEHPWQAVEDAAPAVID